jgi:hypothetical protein
MNTKNLNAPNRRAPALPERQQPCTLKKIARLRLACSAQIGDEGPHQRRCRREGDVQRRQIVALRDEAEDVDGPVIEFGGGNSTRKWMTAISAI